MIVTCTVNVEHNSIIMPVEVIVDPVIVNTKYMGLTLGMPQHIEVKILEELKRRLEVDPALSEERAPHSKRREALAQALATGPFPASAEDIADRMGRAAPGEGHRQDVRPDRKSGVLRGEDPGLAVPPGSLPRGEADHQGTAEPGDVPAGGPGGTGEGDHNAGPRPTPDSGVLG